MTLPPDVHPHVIPSVLRRKIDLPDVFYFDTWPAAAPMCVILDPDVAYQVTVQRSLPKHKTLEDFLVPITGPRSIVSLEGKEWKQWRSLFNPGFASGHLHSLVPGMVDDCVRFRDILQNHLSNDDVFQMEEAATKLTLDIIGKVVLDVSLNGQSSEHVVVTSLRNLVALVPKYNDINPFRIYNPLRPLIARRNHLRMDAYLENVLDERLAMGQESSTDAPRASKRSKPVIDLAIDGIHQAFASSDPQAMAIRKFKKSAITHIKSFLFAGHDTTSSTICYIFYMLFKHPEIRARVCAEYDEVLGTDHASAATKLKEEPHLLAKLSYSTAIIKETLRLFPAASSARMGEPGFFITLSDGTKLPTEGFMVWVAAHGIHRRPDLWPRAEEFIPERWLVPEGDPLYPVKGAWRAFEYGPRNCIGQELAMLETKLIMALTLREFEIVPAYDEWEQAGKGSTNAVRHLFGERAYQVLVATAKPAEGMPVKVRTRFVQ